MARLPKVGEVWANNDAVAVGSVLSHPKLVHVLAVHENLRQIQIRTVGTDDRYTTTFGRWGLWTGICLHGVSFEGDGTCVKPAEPVVYGRAIMLRRL